MDMVELEKAQMLLGHELKLRALQKARSSGASITRRKTRGA
jgi:hypothetical protein